MTVTSSFTAQVKPGRFEDAVNLIRAAAKPIERHGAQNVRLWRGAFSSESYGGLVMSMEYADGEAWGAAYDKTMADDELVTLLSRADSDSSPFASQALATAMEIPVEGPKKQGRVIGVIVSRANPGRFQDAIELGSQMATVQGRLGASSVRLFWVGAAGSISGVLILVTETPDMKTLGRINDAFLADPDGQKLLEGAFGANAAVNVISEEIYTEITL